MTEQTNETLTRTLQGTVTSSKMQKTVTVLVNARSSIRCTASTSSRARSITLMTNSAATKATRSKSLNAPRSPRRSLDGHQGDQQGRNHLSEALGPNAKKVWPIRLHDTDHSVIVASRRRNAWWCSGRCISRVVFEPVSLGRPAGFRIGLVSDLPPETGPILSANVE